MKNQTATIFGSTGLVGQKLAELIAKDDAYRHVYLANRRAVKTTAAKLENVIVDFEHLSAQPQLFEVDYIFICLGTTMRKAGSKEKFRAVDYKLPERIAKHSKAQVLLMISSLGADSAASNFYLKTKGEAEQAVKLASKGEVYFLRPALLLGNRKEKRIGEAIGRFLMEKLDFLMLGPLKPYRGIYDIEVAKAMLQIVKTTPTDKILESSRLKELSNEYTRK